MMNYPISLLLFRSGPSFFFLTYISLSSPLLSSYFSYTFSLLHYFFSTQFFFHISGEIMFFAYGFEFAKECGAKMVTTFKLCSEQLSAQPHYDYGN